MGLLEKLLEWQAKIRSRQFELKKKGQLQSLNGLVLGLLVLAITLAVGFVILTTLGANYAAGSYVRNMTDSFQSALASIPGWAPVIIIAAVGGIVLFLVVRQFGGGSK